MGRLLALVAALIGAALIAWTVQQPPKPRPLSTPADQFSAERAMADVRAMAPVPHPVGSEANHAVRDRLVARMAALGLSPQVRAGVGAAKNDRVAGLVLGGQVENIVGVLPGRDRAAPAVALMAHYDSVPGSPGAADDAAGVASALEIVRALKAQGTPARDVLVLLTDGEEAGLLGANAFFRADPLAHHVGFVINMEARGSAGRVQMFQTGADNGPTIALLRKAAVRPQSASLAVFIYEHMPNDTDFTEAKKAGLAGLNFAFAGRQFDYHSPSSTPATLDPGTLQDMGQQGLAAARAAAFAPDLPGRAPNVVYSQVFGNLIIAYAPAIGWVVLALSAVLIILATVRARRREGFARTDILRGMGAALFAVLGAVTLLHFARRATGAGFGFMEQRFLLAQVTRWESALILLGLGFLLAAIAEIARGRRLMALVPLLAGLAASAFGGFDPVGLGLGVAAALVAVAAYGRPVSRAGAWSGALLFGLLLAVAAQALAAPVAFIVAWPLALAALAAALTDMSSRRGVASLVLIGLAAAVGLGWLAGYAHAAFISLDLVELMAISLLGAALLVWPLAQPTEGAPPERLVGPALVILGLALTVAVRVNQPYDARFPQASYVAYQLDQDARRGWLVSDTPERSAWADAVLKSAGGKLTKLSHWVWRRPVDAAPAPYLAAPAPEMTLSRRPDGALSLRVLPPAGSRQIALALTPDTPATLVSIQGAPIGMPLAPGAVSRVRWDAAKDGLELILKPAGPGTLTVKYAARLPRWPDGAPPLPSRPAQVMPFNDSDSTLVTGARRLAW
ncbi:M20/M25/M40 family metallo-hydrolase [Phenylobacterium soli]|uniref:Vacuolar membrane protease n=1 Tax=Phenylobacterium soli TaxID=2170551 RepID=A0A328AJA9_9CAUL|nr:M20/M25/M40 family metallo-hydrolase [Phenylobacterium soli]RAK54597.1 peptidase M20 [Phenylobacterium soli]